MMAPEFVPDKAPDLFFEEDEESEERLSTGGPPALRPSVLTKLCQIMSKRLILTLAGDGLCLLELVPEPPLDPELDLVFSLSCFLSSLTLELGGLLPARLFPLHDKNSKSRWESGNRTCRNILNSSR